MSRTNPIHDSRVMGAVTVVHRSASTYSLDVSLSGAVKGERFKRTKPINDHIRGLGYSLLERVVTKIETCGSGRTVWMCYDSNVRTIQIVNWYRKARPRG